MIQAFKFKLYKSKKNKHINKKLSIAAHVYNHCIALHKRYYRIYKLHLDKYKLQRHITKLKKLSKYSYWNGLNSQAIQDIVDRIERSYKLFFRNTKTKIKCSPPGFCKSRNYKSFTLKQCGYKLLEQNRVKVEAKIFKYHKSQDILGDIKNVTVKRDVLRDFYIYFVCDVPNKSIQAPTGKSVGLDFGLKTFLTTSNGDSIQTPEFYKLSIAKLRSSQQKLSSKTKGSNNRKKAIAVVARAHKRINNQRKDHHWKLAKQLAETYDTICIEDLNLKGMQMLWGRKISDLSFAEFVNKLEHSCNKTGSKLIKINRFEPSSKTCSNCLAINKELCLKDRIWTCGNCNMVLERDINAAINIKRVGTSTLSLEAIRPSLEGGFA